MNVTAKDVNIFGRLLIFLYHVLNVKLVLGMFQKRKMPFKDKDKNREYQREYQRKWRLLNKDKWKEIRTKSDNRPERKEYQRVWQKESPKFKLIKERFKKTGRHREWEAEKKKNDIAFLTTRKVRNRLKDAMEVYLRNNSIDRIKSSDEYGINYKAIVEHLIKTLPKDFKEKQYEIDHIKACCLFDLTNQEDIKKCFAPENHQWLSVEEHRIKTTEDIKKLKLI